MALKPSLRRRHRQGLVADINVTPFIDILVCLILFLLLTAVLSKSAILNIFLPTENDSSEQVQTPPDNSIIPTVAVTHEGFILNRGHGQIVRIPLKDKQHDYGTLLENLKSLRENPEASKNIVILPEARLRYQVLISTMDTCRQYRDAAGDVHPLFPTISLGEFSTTAATGGAS